MEKLDLLKMPLDPITGEVKYLKELNLLGKRKQKNKDVCNNDNNKSSKSKDYCFDFNFMANCNLLFSVLFNLAYMIGALQKILNKTSEADTKTEVEEYTFKSLYIYIFTAPKNIFIFRLLKELKIESPSSSKKP